MASLSFPSNPVENQIYVGPNQVRYQYKSSRWTTKVVDSFSIEGANPGATPPLSPVDGTFWLDTDSSSLYVYRTATSQWLAVATGSASSDSSGLSLEGTAVYDGTIVLNDVGINLEVLPPT